MLRDQNSGRDARQVLAYQRGEHNQDKLGHHPHAASSFTFRVSRTVSPGSHWHGAAGE
jgi:maltooligosyltrehalose synthase